VVVTPGDNDWLDCHKTGQDPEAGLATLREHFFEPNDDRLTKGLRLHSSSPLPENREWTHEGVLFTSIHFVSLPPGNRIRDAALAAMHAAFTNARASRARALVLLVHANLDFEAGLETQRWESVGDRPELQAALESDSRRAVLDQLAGYGVRPPRRSNFECFVAPLRDEVEDFVGTVLLIYGDTHYFRFDQPLLAPTDAEGSLSNFYRLESHGSPHADRWISVTISSDVPPRISVSAERARQTTP
jgi:hypothetical protein